MIHILLIVGSFFFMEFVAWSNHKYVMHGFLWKWHKDHHTNDHIKRHSPDKIKSLRLEKNDLFFLVYAIPAMVLLFIGFLTTNTIILSIGAGITLYGFIYFLIHDVIIHQRPRIPFLLKKHNFYIKAILNAHHAHHRGRNVRDFNNYGLLIFQLRFFKQ